MVISAVLLKRVESFRIMARSSGTCECVCVSNRFVRSGAAKGGLFG